MNTSMRWPPHIRNIIYSLKGPIGGRLKAKLWLGMTDSNQYLQNDLKYITKGPMECNQRLGHIMRDDLKCIKSANEIKPYLDAFEFRYNMTNDDTLLNSYFVRNCTWLGGRSARICEKGNIDVSYDLFTKSINDCHLEQLEAEASVSSSQR